MNAVPIGLLINMARNADDSESGKDLQQMLDGFSSAMVDWLKS